MTAPPDCHRNRPQNVTEIDAAVPNDLDVHLILDNYATSASWIDLVERWFWFESSPGRGSQPSRAGSVILGAVLGVTLTGEGGGPAAGSGRAGRGDELPAEGKEDAEGHGETEQMLKVE